MTAHGATTRPVLSYPGSPLAARGGVEWTAPTVTSEEHHADPGQVRAEGCHLIEALAQSPDGHVAGCTTITTCPLPVRPARMPGTLVLERLRGHSPGMALKSTAAHWAARTGMTHVATKNNQHDT